MHAKCSLRKMHLEVGRKNVTRPGPIIKYFLRFFMLVEFFPLLLRENPLLIWFSWYTLLTGIIKWCQKMWSYLKTYGPVINYLQRVLNKIHQSFHMKYGKVHVMKGWVQFFYQMEGSCLVSKLMLTTVYKPCQWKKLFVCKAFHLMFCSS